MRLLRLIPLYMALALGANAALATDAATLGPLREGSLKRLILHSEPKPVKVVDFELEDDGGTGSLADYKGKYVLLNFWATWCAPCRKEMPQIAELQQEFGGDKFEVLTLATGRNTPAGIKKFFDENGIDNFRFWDTPLLVPQTEDPDVNVYDMRLTKHEDGYIYGIFCTERKDPTVPPTDTSSAIANAGIIRSKDMLNWERLPDLISGSAQQRNVTLHEEFVDGRYAVYTRPQDGFIETGAGGGIGLGYIQNMEQPVVEDEVIINPKVYHTIYELKNGQGPSPIRTKEGWLHLAHGVRNTAAGLRYVLYLFMTDLEDIEKVIYQPGGYFMAPDDNEIIGDVGNVLFANGWILDDNGDVFIYYASSDTRMHVATTRLEILVDYCKNTPTDKLTSNGSVENILSLINHNTGWYE